MIEIKNVTKRYGKFIALEDISLSVSDQSIYGLVGFNGAGKTTLLKTIAGVLMAENGEIIIDGENAVDNEKTKQKVFYVSDELYFEPYTTIEKTAKFYAGYYPNYDFEILKKLCKVLNLDTKARISSFSKGMQRQAEIAICMAAAPQVILLDECFDGLDPQKRSLLNNMLIEYVAEKGGSVIISSHNLHELTDICDHIGLIDGRKIMLDCCVDDISASRCKFRLAFEEEKTEQDFIGFDYKKFSKDGKLITFTLAGDPDENEARLNMLHPVLVERFPLTLEEIFLEEMEGTDYDFKEIFG